MTSPPWQQLIKIHILFNISRSKDNQAIKLGQLTSRKFYTRRNNNKVDAIETGCIVIALLLPWSDLEKCMYCAFLINDDNVLSSLLNL